jgi:hypothetical protein
MDWRRVGFENRMRDHGAVSVSDEKKVRFDRDRAARWLDRQQQQHQKSKDSFAKKPANNGGDPCPRCGVPMQIRKHHGGNR